MSTNVAETRQLFENAKDAQNQYFSSIIQLVERLELQIEVLKGEKARLEFKIKVLEEQIAMKE